MSDTDRPLDTLSVAPDPADADQQQGAGAPNAGNQERDPRQDAGQDESIARRLERDPENKQAQLDNALDESMDASDPPATTLPSSGEPAPSSGFDEEAERQRQQQG